MADPFSKQASSAEPFVAGSLIIALGVLFLSLALVAPARATTFIVNDAADTTDGSCDPVAGGCTLREAIEAAVATAGRDTIAFDASVFPHGPEPVLITLASELPVIADPAGTAIDGTGASVRIYGAGAIANGLVFASAPGVPLVKPTLASVSVDDFTNHGVEICGGLPPACDADVTEALVRNVFVNSAGSGIAIAGRVVERAQVVDSVTFQTGQGIGLFALSLIGARVVGCTSSRSSGDGIVLAATEQTGSVVVDSFGLKSTDEEGIEIVTSGGGNTNPRIANVVAFQTRNGIVIEGDHLASPDVSDAVASGSAIAGIEIRSGGATSPRVKRVVADANGFFGVHLVGPVTGGEVSQVHVFRHDGAGVGSDGANDLVVSRVLSAENSAGVLLDGANSVVERVHASANSNGIIVTGGDGNVVTKSVATANDGEVGAGIQIDDDSHANVVEKNVALGNGTDLIDASLGCDANTWSDNVFVTRSLPCIH